MSRWLLLTVLVLIPAPVRAATVIYMSGFEGGSTAPTSAGNEWDLYSLAGTYTSTTVHTGGWALAQGNVASTLFAQSGTPAITTSTIACRMYVYFSNSGGGNPGTSFTHTVRYSNGVTIGYSAFFSHEAGNHMVLSDTGAGFTTTVGTATLSGNTWYRMDFIYDVADGGVGQVWIDGVLDINATHTGTNAVVNNMTVNGLAVATHNFDDIYCQDGTAEPPDGRLIVRQGTSGTPTDNSFSLVGCATIDGCWSDTPLDTTKYASSTSTTSAVAQTMIVHPFSTVQMGHGSHVLSSASTVNAVQMMAVAKTSATTGGGDLAHFRTYVNGSGPTDVAATALGITDRGRKSTVATDTVSNLDHYEIGWVKDASASARAQTVEDMWLMVDYSEPAATPTQVKHKINQD